MNKAQTPVDAMCNVNQTFGTDENFVNPWQKSWTDDEKENHEQHCVQQCALDKGLKKHGKRGEDAVLKEITQLHDRACFEPIEVEDMTPEEKQQVQTALTYPTEKETRQLKDEQFATESRHRNDYHEKNQLA